MEKDKGGDSRLYHADIGGKVTYKQLKISLVQASRWQKVIENPYRPVRGLTDLSPNGERLQIEEYA